MNGPILGRFLLVATLLLPAGDPLDAAAKKEITASEAQKVNAFLAGPKFNGRGTGQKGNDDAARWLAGELIAAGWAPGPSPPSGKDGKAKPEDFLQPFEVPAPRGGTGEPLKTANVVGVLEGNGTAAPVATGEGAPAPARLAEVLVLGAHFDHLGVQGGAEKEKEGKAPKKSSVYWGADDNASGTTALLLVARALGRMAREGTRPRRTVVLCFFSAEEIGLLGSKHYVGKPVRPLADTAAMINLDMIGRNATKHLEVFGNASSVELDAWHRKVLEHTKFECVYPPPDLLQRSDQWSFYEAKIPILFFFGGFHGDYHTVRDVPQEVNAPKVALVARHALGVAWLAANDEKRPVFRPIEMKGAGGKLGLAVDPCTAEEIEALGLDEKSSGVRVTTVFGGGLAEKLLQPGDLVYSWNGFPLYADDPVARFQSFVNAAREGDQVVIRYLRGKEKRAATVKF